MAKKERQKQFNKIGLRREITQHILSCGCITNKDVGLMAESGERRSTVDIYLKRMKEEGFLKEVKANIYYRSYRIFKLADFKSNEEILKDAFGENTVSYYKLQKEYIDNLLTDWNANNSNGRNKLLRAVRRSHTAMLMKNAYIRTMADDFDKTSILNQTEKLDINGSYFFFLDELKNSFSNILNSRAVGMLVTPDANYIVYNQFQNRNQISDVEMRTKELGLSVNDYLRSDLSKVKNINAAILISEEKPILKMLTETEEEQEQRKTRVFELPEPIFDKLYYVPSSIDGCKVLRQMSKENWEEDLIKNIGQMYGPKKKTWLVHHATNGDNCYVYYFCLSELNSFKRFIVQTNEYLDKLQFEVVCFKYQEEFLKKVLDERIKITVIEDI